MACRSEIGLKIKHARIDKGLTQEQVSKLTRINKTTISEIENGRFTGSFDIFERLLNAVDLQFEVVEKTHQLPDWDEIEELFAEDGDE
ncbi:helix-turn-helix domain-containing protein [Vibrio splendidus]